MNLRWPARTRASRPIPPTTSCHQHYPNLPSSLCCAQAKTPAQTKAGIARSTPARGTDRPEPKKGGASSSRPKQARRRSPRRSRGSVSVVLAVGSDEGAVSCFEPVSLGVEAAALSTSLPQKADSFGFAPSRPQKKRNAPENKQTSIPMSGVLDSEGMSGSSANVARRTMADTSESWRLRRARQASPVHPESAGFPRSDWPPTYDG